MKDSVGGIMTSTCGLTASIAYSQSFACLSLPTLSTLAISSSTYHVVYVQEKYVEWKKKTYIYSYFIYYSPIIFV